MVSKAEFARRHGVSRAAVQKWEAAGYLVMRDGKVDAEASDGRLRDANLGRFKSVNPAIGKQQVPEPLGQVVATKPRRRRVVASRKGTAAQVLGRLDGADLWGVTNGQFSLIDMIEHVLDQVGPADLVVSTWTMGIYDRETSERFCHDGRIKRIRWLLDPSLFSRRPELSGQLVKAFGVDSFRAANTHAKFVVIRGVGKVVTIASSMSLNPNNRIEHFVLTEAEEPACHFEAIADEAWRVVPAGETKTQARAAFEDILKAFEPFEAGGTVAPPRLVQTEGQEESEERFREPANWTKAEAERQKEINLAGLRRLEFEERAGKLVEMAKAEKVLFEVAKAARDMWMNWPARIAPMVAADLGVDADKATEVLTSYVHEQLSQLGEPEADLSR